ncbi:hypothetical protein [Embleya sp. NPDC005971]|uniref:DUF7003 family protein n=1 Tax=Embleya sp. NPDC005971 TaxID=3156724 RepID=UPI0033EE9435
MKTVSSILGQFDLAYDTGRFPDLDNGYHYPVDVRMHLFADPHRWAWVVELLGYSPRGRNLIDVVHVFGNCLTHGDIGPTNDFLHRVDNMDDVEGDGDDAEQFRGGVPIVVRGRALVVDAAQGTPLEDVFRSLVPEHRELLLADDREVRAGIPADIPLVLRLDEWHQPTDLSDDHRPGGHPFFRAIAEVLDTGDADGYRPTEAPNTHWSNRPDAGTL